MNKTDVEQLEKITGQLEGLHKEIGSLTKKSANDALNKFKLGFVNAALNTANAVLGPAYQPFATFSQFEEDDVPSNSDVTLILGQYLEELERKRADNIKRERLGGWIYNLDDPDLQIKTAPPRKIELRK